MHRLRDIILVGATAALLGLAVLPEDWLADPGGTRADPKGTGDGDVSGLPSATNRPEAEDRLPDKLDETIEAVERHRTELDAVTALAKSSGRSAGNRRPQRIGDGETPFASPPPASTGDTPLMPLTAGTVWQYQVSGDEKLATADIWTLKLVSEPAGDQPGMAEIRFGKQVTTAALHHRQGALRLQELPFVTPTDLEGVEIVSGEGELLPPQARMVEGAVWNDVRHLKLQYTYRDDKGKRHEIPADAVIRNRANVKGFEGIVVPAGRFGAYRVEWLSRVAITAQGRPILAHLTTEPYRRETMWISPGIGIVKRQIAFLRGGRRYRSVTLALETFTKATPTAAN